MNRAALVLSLLLLLAGLLAGCSDGPGHAAPIVVESRPPDEVRSNETIGAALTAEPKGRGHIAGIVVDEAVRPLAGAAVRLPGLDVVRKTDRDGSFGFVDLRPGPYFLTVNATGYYPAEAVVDVREGEFTRAKVILSAIPPPQPYHVTQSFDGFADVTDVDTGPFSINLFCGTCEFEFYVDRPGLQAIVVEASADGAVQGDGFQHSLYGDNGSLEYGSSSVPMRFELKDEDLGSGDHFGLGVYPTSFPAPEASKRFQVFVTAFYNQPPPTGWSVVGGDA